MWRNRVLRGATVLALGSSSIVLSVPQIWAARSASGRVTRDIDDVPARPVALVLGAGLQPDGFPTPMLADRVHAAVELYRRGIVDHLLLSGDNSRADHDEPTSMRRVAIDAGVPAAAITLDFAGFSTFESCARAREVFGVEAAIVVTQDFHATRAVATCRAKGIDAVAFAQSTAGYATSQVRALETRERAAIVKALWDDVRAREPHFAGPFVGLAGSTSLPELNQRWDDQLESVRSGR